LTLQFKEMDIVTKRTLRAQGKDRSEKDRISEYGSPIPFKDNTGSE